MISTVLFEAFRGPAPKMFQSEAYLGLGVAGWLSISFKCLYWHLRFAVTATFQSWIGSWQGCSGVTSIWISPHMRGHTNKADVSEFQSIHGVYPDKVSTLTWQTDRESVKLSLLRPLQLPYQMFSEKCFRSVYTYVCVCVRVWCVEGVPVSVLVSAWTLRHHFNFPLHPEYVQKASRRFGFLTYFNGKMLYRWKEVSQWCQPQKEYATLPPIAMCHVLCFCLVSVVLWKFLIVSPSWIIFCPDSPVHALAHGSGY